MSKESFGNTLGGCVFLFCLGIALIIGCLVLGNYLQTLH